MNRLNANFTVSMGYLVLCIFANVGIFTCFRAFSRVGINTFHAIVVNYVICVFTGILFAGKGGLIKMLSEWQPWGYYAILLGGIFIGTFYLMARTTQVFSMTVSSIATKMSLVIPVLFSLLILGIKSKEYSLWNYAGMIMALIAIVAASYKPGKVKLSTSESVNYLLPVSIFILGGIIDSTINYVSYKFLRPDEEAVFPMIIFLAAAVTGLIILLVRRQTISLKSAGGGVVLGVVNYFSVYYLVRSLASFGHDGALVYPMINVGIILIAAGVSALFFNERLTLINKAGILAAIASIVLLSYQELLQFL